MLVRCVLRLQSMLLLAGALALGACVDSTLAPRAWDINQGTQSVRESAILMNIVRASRSEPLNFTPLSKYTGTGTVSMNQSLLKNQLAINPPASSAIEQAFTSSVNAGLGNSFDVGTLETKDFYGGFMSPLSLESLALLMNAGINKELVLHSVLQGFRVKLAGRSLLFVNNPDDDRPWNGTPCASLYDGTERAFEPVAQSMIWRDTDSCKYQKFLYFLRVAVRWGVTVEAYSSPRGKGGGKGKSDKADDGPSVRYYVCYDPAIAIENKMPGRADAPGACGSKLRNLAQTREFEFRFEFNSPIEGVAPIVRSPYAVFQYYGQLLANQKHGPVELSEVSRYKDPRREARLLTIQEGGVDCFAQTLYGGRHYCVPNEGTKNTKEIFVLLNTLVALSTSRSSLPVSPTFVLTP